MLLRILEESFAICRLDPLGPVPEWASGVELFSLTRTPEELSIICEHALVPEGVRHEGPWRAIRVVGTLDFGEVGILSSLTVPLADAGISLFALSTFDTDYLLVFADRLEATCDALRAAGHEVL